MQEFMQQSLSVHDLHRLISLSRQSLQCSTERQLQPLTMELKELIEAEKAVFIQADSAETLLDPDGEAALFNISYPVEFIEVYKSRRYHLTDRVWKAALETLRPVHWQTEKSRFGPWPSFFLSSDYGMNDGWAVCIADAQSDKFTMFFAGKTKPSGHDARACRIIEYVIPFYALACARISGTPSKPPCRLTKKETEVLNWIKEGKSSWEISCILNCSKRVVDFHVVNIKTKLDAVSRAQCVAKAIDAGFIGI